MIRIRPLAATLAVLALSLLAACDDPSNVGLGLVGEEGGAPATAVLPLDDAVTVADDTLADVTGGAARVLAGTVLDPLVGRIETAGYLDLTPLGVDGRTNKAAVTAATLQLEPNYLYGDSLAPVRLRLRDVREEWEAGGLESDTTLAVGAPITEFTFQPTDTLVAVDLPRSWVNRNSDVLLDTAFAETFHGFQMEGVSDETVVGFDAVATRLRLIAADGDTLRLGGDKRFTRIVADRTQADPEATENRLLLQDGTGLDVGFSVSRAELDRLVGRAPLNRTTLRLPVAEDLPRPSNSFVRPAPQVVTLIGLSADGSGPVNITTLGVGSDGFLQSESGQLLSLLQAIVLDETDFERFRLQPAPFASTTSIENSLNLLAIPTARDDPDGGPRLILTYTPLD